MERDEYDKMATLQATHWWFEAKRRMAGALLRRHGLPRPGMRSLEIGCGTGAMLPVLGRRPVAIDRELIALRHVAADARACGDAMALPLQAGVFDLVACFDLLYHRAIVDVAGALSEIARVTAPAGRLLITDSAGPALLGAHDRAHHGVRRFRRRDIVRAVEEAGFRTEFAGHFHTAVWPAVAASRIGGRWLRRLRRRAEEPTGVSQLQPAPAVVNRAMNTFYRAEVAVASRIALPVGVSVVVLARRQG